jgi:hypothetical protein
MRQTDLAGTRPASAADEARVAGSVVRCAKGAAGNEWPIGAEHPADALEPGDFERLVEREWRQNRGDGARQQGFARTRRADHQHVMDKTPAQDSLLSEECTRFIDSHEPFQHRSSDTASC